MRITVEDVKSFLKVKDGMNNLDLLFGQLIDYAYAFFGSYAEYDPNTSIFREFVRGNNGIISPAGMARDISLLSVVYESTDIALSDITQVGQNKWRLPTAYCGSEIGNEMWFTVTYKSPSLDVRLRKIALDIIVFEYKKSPLGENLINRLSKSLDGITSETFIGSEYFYRDIGRELSSIFFIGM